MLIFLYGDDSFRSSQKLAKIKEKFLLSDQSGSGLSIFDFQENNDRKDFLEVFATPNMLAPKRLAVIKNAISGGNKLKQDRFLEFLKKNIKTILAEKDLVAVIWESSLPNKKNTLFSFLEKNAQKQNFEICPRWIW